MSDLYWPSMSALIERLTRARERKLFDLLLAKNMINSSPSSLELAREYADKVEREELVAMAGGVPIPTPDPIPWMEQCPKTPP